MTYIKMMVKYASLRDELARSHTEQIRNLERSFSQELKILQDSCNHTWRYLQENEYNCSICGLTKPKGVLS